MGEGKNRVLLNTINSLDEESLTNSKCEPFANLKYGEQLEVLDIMLKSFKIVFRNQLVNREVITLPTIGKLKIKEGTIIAKNIREKVYKEFGYNDKDEIKKDDVAKIESKVSKEISSVYEDLKKKKKSKSVKIFKFKAK